MSLTGSTFQWLTIGAAIAVTIAIILLWNRVRGPRPVKLATRFVMLASGYLTAAVAVLVSINITYGGLIATWDDLSANLNPAPGNWHPHYRHGHRHGPLPVTPAMFGGPHQLPPPNVASGHQHTLPSPVDFPYPSSVSSPTGS
jgi:hypothetical protein